MTIESKLLNFHSEIIAEKIQYLQQQCPSLLIGKGIIAIANQDIEEVIQDAPQLQYIYTQGKKQEAENCFKKVLIAIEERHSVPYKEYEKSRILVQIAFSTIEHGEQYVIDMMMPTVLYEYAEAIIFSIVENKKLDADQFSAHYLISC